MVQSSETKL